MSSRVAAPTERREFEPGNRLLAALPGRDLLSLQPHLEAVSLASGSVLFDVDEPLKRVYFVETGVASLVTAVENSIAVGMATVGREGVVGAATLLMGGDTALGRCQVLVPGSALAVEVSPFRSALRRSRKLRAACAAHTRALLIQMLQAAPCNRLHTAEQRYARWLLMCADRTDGDTIELAQKCFVAMVGVRQSTLTVIARKLQNAGLICCNRSAIKVLDRRGLEAVACECYRRVRERHERILARALG